MENLTPSTSLEEFFSHRIKIGLSDRHLSVSPEVEFYLVHLLTRFAQTSLFFADCDKDQTRGKPLAFMLHDAVFQPEKKFYHLKMLGDTALYHAGVFFDSLLSSHVGVDYYIAMGQTAYQSLAGLSTHRQNVLGEVFDELGKYFNKLVDVLNTACSPETTANDHDIIKILERYLKTGSSQAREILIRLGIDLDSVHNNKTVQ